MQARAGESLQKLAGSAPREELEAERDKLQALQRAYRNAAEQASRSAGAQHECVRLEDERDMLREQLKIAEASAASNGRAAREATAALEAAAKGGAAEGGRGGAAAVRAPPDAGC